MAKRRKKSKKRGAFKKRFLLLLLALLAAACVWGAVNAHIVHVDYVDAYIENLSPFLEGTRVLFASDFKITSESDAARAVTTIRRLAGGSVKPDIILLGGDYTAYTLADAMRTQTQEGQTKILNRLQGARRVFFAGLRDVYAPGGIFAVAGDAESAVPGLSEDCRVGNVYLLDNGTARTLVNNTPVYIVGCRDYKTGDGKSYRFSGPSASDDTVLAFTHNPDACKQISSVNDKSGSPLADLIFCGHTLGGQISCRG